MNCSIKTKRIVSVILCVALVVNTIIMSGKDVYATNANNYEKYVFVDGLEYVVGLDVNNNIYVKCVTDGYRGEMLLDSSLNGEIIIDGNEQYEIEIEELNYNDDNLDVVVYDENNNIVEEYDSCDELLKDEYVGQASIAVSGGTIAVGSLLTALLYASLAITISGVICYAVDAVIKDVRKNSKYCYKAYRRLNTVFINPNAISTQTATERIRSGADTYTYTSELAESIVRATGLGVTPSENHKEWYKIGSYFNHYHKKNRNGAHSFYGIPK